MPHVALKQATIEYQVIGPEDSPHPARAVRPRHPGRPSSVGPGRRRIGAARISVHPPDWPLGSHTVPVNTDADLSPRGIATLIDDFITALGLSGVTLVGNDTGGGLCQFVIDAHPEVVGRLVLTNCDAFDKFPPFPFTLVFALLRGPDVYQVPVRSDEAEGAAAITASASACWSTIPTRN